MHSQTVVTQCEGEAPKVCLEFGDPGCSEASMCRVGKAGRSEEWDDPDSGEHIVSLISNADRCDLCKAEGAGEPLLCTKSEQGNPYYADMEFAVCESCTKAAFEALRAARRRMDRIPPIPS